MKTFKSLFAAAMLVAMVMIGGLQQANASSPLRFGLKAGVNMNELKFNESAFSSDNRSGFTGGAMIQFIAPVINLGFDASVMYTHRTTSIATDATEVDDVTVGNDYIEVPINLRYNFSLPFLGSYVSPFLTTGPDFSFLMSNENVKDAWNNKKVDFAWNFGIGLKLVDKIEIAASYGLGLKNSASGDSALYGNNIADGKNRFWTVTAAWLF
jgi:hypothetical protein